MVIADIDPNRDVIADRLREEGMTVQSAALDVSMREDWHRLAEEMLASHGGASILCNNAGLTIPRAAVGAYEPELWDRVIRVNLTGVFNGCHTMLSTMRLPDRTTRILNTASISGLFATPGLNAYTASKHAVVALSDALRFEQAGENVTVSVLCPGFVNTSITLNSQRFVKSDAMSNSEREAMKTRLAGSMHPDVAGEIAVKGLLEGRPYIFPHPEYQAVFDRRSAVIREAFASTAATGTDDEIAALGGAWLGH
ncbi:SDR family NAD(P)-dependent oxidoreductase [Martelella sp. AMO21009]